VSAVISPPLIWVRCYCTRCLNRDKDNNGWLVRRDVAVASDYDCPECGRMCDFFNREDA
jgi:hypothetical protein